MTQRRRLFLLVAIAPGLAALPASALADTLCVGNPGGSCDQSFTGDGTGLQNALDAAQTPAHSGNDTVRIDAGTYTGLFSYGTNSQGNVSIVGAGPSQTTLTMAPQPVSQSVITLGPAGQAISDLSISVPEDSDPVGTHSETGLSMTGSTATNLQVTSPTGDNIQGVVMFGGTFQNGSISLALGAPSATNGNAAILASGDATVRDTSAVALLGIKHNSGTGFVTRARITASFEGIEEAAGTTNVDDAEITTVNHAGLPPGVGIAADNRNNGTSNTDMTINARHLTIVGGGAGTIGAFAVAVGNDAMPDTVGLANATVNLADSVISGPAIALEASADNHRDATINTEYSNYDPATDVLNNNAHGNGLGFPAINASNQTNFGPGFVDPGGGDFHLMPGSPLIDAGDPAGVGPLSDLDGNPRVVAGNCGAARRDIGAYEFQPSCPAPPPQPVTDTSPPQTKIDKGPHKKTSKTTAKFRFESSEAGSTFECKLDRKPLRRCRSPKTYRHLRPGRHVFMVRATDAAGNTDATPAKRKFTVLEA
jgi:hypothetical protein